MRSERQFEVLEKCGLWIVAGVALVILHLVGQSHYVIFHSIVELFAVVVACGIFMLAWNCRSQDQNDYLLFLGVAYLFVATIDVLHTLSYAGMNVFPNQRADLATQLWIGARFIESSALLLAPLLSRHHKKVPAGLVFGCFTVITTLLLLSVFYWHIFPPCSEAGRLTPFKKVSEWVISGILLTSIALLWRMRASFDRHVLRMLIGSIVLTIASELSFTLYQNVYDLANEIGHLLKLASFYLIYRAVIQTGIREPFSMLLRDLKTSNEALEARNHELQSFARILRHDLGNPLFSIDMLVQSIGTSCNRVRKTLQEGQWDWKRNDEMISVLADRIPHSLQSIKTSLDMMKTMLEGLRQVAAAGYRILDISHVDMNALLKQVAESLEPKITSSGALMTIGDLPPCRGDQTQLTELFTNLLSNAVKYLDSSRQGRIRITGFQEHKANVYCVEDNGIGIAPEHREMVFELFGRVDPDGSVEGEGLGLTIVQKVTGRHQGRVWFESEAGKGTRFFVALPSGSTTRGRAKAEVS